MNGLAVNGISDISMDISHTLMQNPQTQKVIGQYELIIYYNIKQEKQQNIYRGTHTR